MTADAVAPTIMPLAQPFRTAAGSDPPVWFGGLDYQWSLADEANGLMTSGATPSVLHVSSGQLMAATYVEVTAGNETVAQWRDNVASLGQIAAYCSAHGIGVAIEANLAFNDVPWWSAAVSQAGLPVIAVEDDQEALYKVSTDLGLTKPGLDVSMNPDVTASLTKIANTMMLGAHEVQSLFPNAQFGYWIGNREDTWQDTMDSLVATWLRTYKAVANANNLPGFSYVISDNNWFGSSDDTTWMPSIEQLSTVVHQNGASLVNLISNGHNFATASDKVSFPMTRLQQLKSDSAIQTDAFLFADFAEPPPPGASALPLPDFQTLYGQSEQELAAPAVVPQQGGGADPTLVSPAAPTPDEAVVPITIAMLQAGQGMLPSGSTLTQVFLADGIDNISPDTTAAFAARLYLGVLGRPPDMVGLGEWTAWLNTGVDTVTVTQSFLSTPEARLALRQTGDSRFINNLYQAMLKREPGPDAEPWVQGLNQNMSRPAVVAAITGSAEAIASWSSETTNLLVPDADVATITLGYATAFGRTPDPSGAAAWSVALHRGLTTRQFVDALVSSPEWSLDHAGQDVTGLVSSVYQTGLGRLPSSTELGTMAGSLGNGLLSTDDLVLQVATSSEARAHTFG